MSNSDNEYEESEEVVDQVNREQAGVRGLETEQRRQVAELKVLRSTTKGNISRIKKLIKEKGSSISVTELECRLGILESYFKQNLNVQMSLEKMNVVGEEKTNAISRADVEDLYVVTKSEILTLLAEKKPSASVCDNLNATLGPFQHSSRSSNLEKIKLPSFSGKFSEFPNFIGLFSSLVDKDDSLDNLQKFNYLRNCLSGSALSAVREYDLSSENYAKALSRLKTRFDSKAMIFQEHINGILAIPKMSKCSSFQLRNLEDSFNTHLAAMLSIGDYKNIAESILISLALDRVDLETKAKWDEATDHSKLPSWSKFSELLDRRCQTLEAKESKICKVETSTTNNNFRSRSRNTNRNQSSNNSLVVNRARCEFCQSSTHDIVECPDFNQLSVSNRFLEVKRRVLCINCLGKGHSVRRCNSQKCTVCSLPHHRLLHRYTVNNPARVEASDRDTAPSTSTSCTSTIVSNTCDSGNANVILATAIVYIRDRSGKFQPVRALLDSASQLNFITEDMVQKLKLHKAQTHTFVSGIGKSNSVVQHKTEASCKSRLSDFELNLDLLILKSITNIQPEKEMDISDWNIPKNIPLADPYFNVPSRIDLLIGADSFFHLLCVGQIKLGPQLPVLQKTLLGWIASGSYGLSEIPQAACMLVGCSDFEEASLNETVNKFWEMEEVNRKPIFQSPEEEECEEEFLRSVRRNEDGRFVVKILLNPKKGQLGDSLSQARKRFFSLERRLQKNDKVREQYIQFMEEYESLGHMEVVPRDQVSLIRYFAPHQFVLRPDSLTTKLRVVFDCSAKTSSNMSLNDLLLKGPVIQDDLYDIVLRFRSYQFVISADVSKMYRQILVADEDRNFQCVLWRSHDQKELMAYRLKTVTYGTTSAPYLATRCLKLLADEHISKFPIGAKVIGEDFYMDDMITGADSLEDIYKIYCETSHILQTAGFDLRKWCSNDTRILDRISGNEPVSDSLRINDKDVIKTLGIIWNPLKDEFQYVAPDVDFSKPITKRRILSELAQIFDPLGLINPIVVKGKIIMQDLWISKCNWDESVPMEIHSQWEAFRKDIVRLGTIKIPRYIHYSRRPNVKVELHGFADASIRAYGCVVYLRTIDTFGEVKCCLLSAKSKVAPIKTKSLPRLELCAAVLLVDLVQRILLNLGENIEEIYLWTDSEIVLHWISAYPSSWEIFVANRVSKIQSELPAAIWRHVGSKSNPADIVSRGSYTFELMQSMWFDGPSFLYLSNENWPKQKISSSIAKLETNTPVALLAKIVSEEFSEHFSRFSSYQKTIRVFGYVVRFMRSFKRKFSLQSPNPPVRPKSSGLTADELEEALLRIIWNLQQTHFQEEIDDLKKKQMISPKSVISSLNPFLDDEHSIKLLRVGGRLLNANIPYNVKCPLLLPKNSLFVNNLVVHLHVTNFHAGIQALVAIMRQRFWVLNARNVAKKTVFSCHHCFRYKPKLLKQIMGDLPASRVTISRPFARSGVDFCGPFQISQGRRGYCTHKAYVAVFICFATKAIHLEVVSDLSTQGFLAALKRFVARRGLCEEIHCDNGTNFVGARNELKELYNVVLEQQKENIISSWCALHRIKFVHIPPRAPHFGGLWEAAVKSAKFHLYRTVKQTFLTYEEFSTVIAEIEAILNSRPICVLGPDPNDEQVLTPGHLLIGNALNSLPEPTIPDDIPPLKRWRRLTQIKQHFWTRWSKEYLLELQRRTKWKTASENATVGTVVLVGDDNLPPQQWLLGKIERLITGADGKIRVADVRVKGTVLRRPIHRLAPLPSS